MMQLSCGKSSSFVWLRGQLALVLSTGCVELKCLLDEDRAHEEGTVRALLCLPEGGGKG